MKLVICIIATIGITLIVSVMLLLLCATLALYKAHKEDKYD